MKFSHKVLFFSFAFFFICLINIYANKEIISYLHPQPNSSLVSSETNIAIRFADSILLDEIILNKIFIVRGRECVYKGKAFLAEDKKTILFVPEISFKENDLVIVSIFHEFFSSGKYVYSFQISGSKRKKNVWMKNESSNYKAASTQQQINYSQNEIRTINGVTVPSDFPIINISTNKNNTAPGLLFFGIREGYYIIMENDGTPLYYRKSKDFLVDFKVQAGNKITRAIDHGTITSGGDHYFVAMDNQYNDIDTFSAKNGYLTDAHDFLLLENGHSILIAADIQNLNLTDSLGKDIGFADVIGNHIQELDENKNVIFEWRSWDHYRIADAPFRQYWDYVHMNSIALDYDDHILVSCRNLSECTKINRTTGKIIWRLGGVHNQFKFLDSLDQISFQHSFAPVSGKPNHYTLFDNGNEKEPMYSRAIEIKIDPVLKTVQKVWEYRRTPDAKVNWLGGIQGLSNGNYLINWGYAPYPLATEITPEGELVYEAFMPEDQFSYRTFRFNWEGIADRPSLFYEYKEKELILIFNKFGDPDVDYYTIYIGKTEAELVELTTTKNTSISLSDLENKTIYYVAITSTDQMGIESKPSNTEEIFINFANPGNNLVLNGDFASKTIEPWKLNTFHNSEAIVSVTAQNQCQISIQNSGHELGNIQLIQTEIPIYKGYSYQFEFDAYATSARLLDAKIINGSDPWTNYGRINPTSITNRNKHYMYEFLMEDETDVNASLIFDCGQFSSDVYISNVSIKSIDSLTNSTKKAFSEFHFNSSPNPFIEYSNIEFSIPSPGMAELKLHNNTGQLIMIIYRGKLSSGKHSFPINGNNLAEGFYTCNLSVTTVENNSYISVIKICHLR